MVKSQVQKRSNPMERLKPFQPGPKRILGWSFGVLVLLVIVGSALTQALVEGLWFQEVGYLSIFWTERLTQGVLWVMALALTIGSIGSNLWAARYWNRHRKIKFIESTLPKCDVAINSGYLELTKLLASVMGLALFLVIMLTHYIHQISTFWQPNIEPQAHSLQQFSIFAIGPVWTLWRSHPLLGAIGLITTFFLLAFPIFTLSIVAILLGLGFGLILSRQWTIILAAFNTSAFGKTDPLFHVDLGFYVFQLPFWELIQFMFLGTSLVCFVGVSLFYLVAGRSLTQGRLPALTVPMQRHLYGLAGVTMIAIALSWGLNCYTLLYSTEGTLFGAGYTDTKVHLPVRVALGIGALVIAVLFFWRAIDWHRARRRIRFLSLLGGYMGFALGLGVILPVVVQSAVVLPNELVKERPYIQYSLEATRHAFGLDTIQTETFNPSDQLTPQVLDENDLTVRNIRLWDTSPLLEANRQLQRIRPYYEFADADIDRYILPPERQPPDDSTAPTFEKRQVLISARELDFNAVPQAANRWINKRLIYTHGYGFTVSPVNQAAPSGLPEYFIQDITGEETQSNAPLDPLSIEASIPTQTPRIYFGEMTDNYVLTSTNVKELDYPSGNENVYNQYAGRGGIRIGQPWRRFVFAWTLRDWQMMLTQNITPETKILYRRQIKERVKAIAPFLRLDNDPYLVSAPVKEKSTGKVENVLYWIIDAYTLSDRYPYSDPGEQPFNYIHNSVKVVVDALSGAVDFYSVEPNEPLLNTWEKVFPNLIQPLSAMPSELRDHIRYPIDLFQSQSQSLLTYHMTDPQVFYNREDQWRFPNEIYGNERSQIKPYYLILKLPEEQTEEFVLLIPFTPVERNNLIAWMAARSDGNNYGKHLLYQFPKRQLVFGPEQVEALINQDPVISQQISLWNRQGSRVLQGNLLIIPIERSLLYVEPLYLEAEQTGVPTLARVIVLYEDRIVMAESLDEAMKQMFKSPTSSTEAAIVREIQRTDN